VHGFYLACCTDSVLSAGSFSVVRGIHSVSLHILTFKKVFQDQKCFTNLLNCTRARKMNFVKDPQIVLIRKSVNSKHVERTCPITSPLAYLVSIIVNSMYYR
jgi:hypothetical protein